MPSAVGPVPVGIAKPLLVVEVIAVVIAAFGPWVVGDASCGPLPGIKPSKAVACTSQFSEDPNLVSITDEWPSV